MENESIVSVKEKGTMKFNFTSRNQESDLPKNELKNMWESLYAERELLVAFYGSLKSNLYETAWFPNFIVEDCMICKQFCCMHLFHD